MPAPQIGDPAADCRLRLPADHIREAEADRGRVLARVEMNVRRQVARRLVDELERHLGMAGVQRGHDGRAGDARSVDGAQGHRHGAQRNRRAHARQPAGSTLEPVTAVRAIEPFRATLANFETGLLAADHGVYRSFRAAAHRRCYRP